MDERRGAGQILSRLKGNIDDEVASAMEFEVKVKIAESRNRGFKKLPDAPLGVVIACKKSKRLRKR
jgi:hypothetical protein